MAHPLDVIVVPLNQRTQLLVGNRTEPHGAKIGVGLDECRRITSGVRGLLLAQVLTQHPEVMCAQVVEGGGEGRRLEQTPNLVKIRQVFPRHFRGGETSAGRGDQSFVHQQRQRLPYRSARDAELLGKIAFSRHPARTDLALP